MHKRGVLVTVTEEVSEDSDMTDEGIIRDAL